MTTPTPSPSEAMRLAEEAHSAMLTFAEEVWQAGTEGFNTSTVAPCREARANAEAAINHLRDLTALASTQAAEVEALKAKQIDVEAVMRLAEVYAKASSELDESIRSRSRAPRLVNRHDLRVHVAFKAAREALRAALLGDGGTL